MSVPKHPKNPPIDVDDDNSTGVVQVAGADQKTVHVQGLVAQRRLHANGICRFSFGKIFF